MPNLNEALKYPFLVSLVLMWALVWKGFALWKAANRQQLSWYIILLIFNTMGLLEIAYIFYLNRFDLGSKALMHKISQFKAKK